MEEISELNFWQSSVSVPWLQLEASELLAKAVGHIHRRLRPQLLQPVIESRGFVFLNTLTAACRDRCLQRCIDLTLRFLTFND